MQRIVSEVMHCTTLMWSRRRRRLTCPGWMDAREEVLQEEEGERDQQMAGN